MQVTENLVTDKNDDLPMTLWLQGAPTPLLWQEKLRVVSGKRWVVSGYWGEQLVVAKVFTKLKYAQRELKGLQALASTGVKTPTLLHHGWIARHPFYILVFEKIHAAEDVDSAWWSGDAAQRVTILNQLVILTAQLHKYGVTQHDLHLQNFLLNANEIYVIDAADITQTSNGQALTERAGLSNLARLFAQLSPEYDQECEQAYRLYAKECGLVFTQAALTELKKWIRHWRQQHLRIYGKKIFRNTSKLQCSHSLRRFAVWNRAYDSEALQQLLADPEAAMKNPASKSLKDGNTCTVNLIEIDGKLLVIKRYNIKGFWHGLKRAFRNSRAAICWRNAMCLASWRLGVAKPIAMIEKRIGPLRRQAYFITEYVPGIRLQDFFITQKPSPEEMTNAASNIKQLFTNLENIWISHGDLKADNLLLVGQEPILLDLDAMRMHRFSRCWQRSQQRDTQRFMKNWQEYPEIAKVFSELME